MCKNNLVIDLLEKQAEINPKKIALIFGNREWTFYSLNAIANSIGRWLINQGIKQQDRILVYCSNSDWVIISLFGILKAGAIFVPVNPMISETSLIYIFQDAMPSMVVTDLPLYTKTVSKIGLDSSVKILLPPPVAENFVPNAPNIFYWDNFFTSTPDDSNLDTKANPDDIALIIYTSGSTGEPKGIIEPHRSIMFVTNAINQVIGNTEEDKILCGLPLSFDYGLYQIFLAFQVGAQIIISDFSFPLGIPGLIKQYGITGFPGVPSLFSLLIRSKLLERISLPNLRYITSTGDVLPVELIEKLQKIFPHTLLFPMYGLTECKRVSILPNGHLKDHLGSVGLPLPGTQVSIIDEAGKELSDGLVGELIVKGPHVMRGYWNDFEETEKRFKKLKNQTVLFTNDLFIMDRARYLYFQGRKDNFIKSRGQKVNPISVERVLYSIEGVAEAAVIGKPDPILGEAIIAVISKDAGKVMRPEKVLEVCRHRLSPVEIPSRVIIFEKPLPKTPNGKIDRIGLRTIFEKEPHDDDLPRKL